jgi:hypothetical protein
MMGRQIDTAKTHRAAHLGWRGIVIERVGAILCGAGRVQMTSGPSWAAASSVVR